MAIDLFARTVLRVNQNVLDQHILCIESGLAPSAGRAVLGALGRCSVCHLPCENSRCQRCLGLAQECTLWTALSA